MSGPRYDERLSVPVWMWPVGLVLALLLAAQLHSGADGARAVVPYVLVPAVAVAGLLVASRGRVRVDGGVLHVPGARIPVALLGDAVALDEAQTRQLRGPYASADAFVATRPWLTRAVRVEVDDPADDTPYWLVGTRRPQELAAVLGGSAGEVSPSGGRGPSS